MICWRLVKELEFINDGTEVPLAKIELKDCEIENIDLLIRVASTTYGSVSKTGDTMTGKLNIDRSADEGDEGRKHIHLVALSFHWRNGMLIIHQSRKPFLSLPRGSKTTPPRRLMNYEIALRSAVRFLNEVSLERVKLTQTSYTESKLLCRFVS